MNKIFFLLFCVFSNLSLFAHEHVAIGASVADPSQLVVDGPGITYAPYLPPGETFSAQDAPHFPGGCFVGLLTFTTEWETSIINPLPITSDYNPEVELIAVDGPEGALFSFWEQNSITPTWSRMTGWRQTTTDRPSFPVALNAWGHIHGRAFTTDHPGDYTVVFRIKNILFSSADYRITFKAVSPPPLSIRLENGQVVISFLSRLNFLYDLQLSTDITSGSWDSVVVDFIEGDGTVKETSLMLEHPRAFFRLVEF